MTSVYSNSSSLPDISIIIRAKNEGKLIRQCLESILDQLVEQSLEIILIDSGSTDDTLSIAKRFSNVRIHSIPPEEFNYGGALNLGVQLSKGRYIVCLSAHCVPMDRQWLSHLLDPLLQDEDVAGSFGRQVPWPECEPIERKTLADLFGRDMDYMIDKSSRKGQEDILFSNANSCLRTELVQKFPFRELAYGEDQIWAGDMVRRGYKLAYCSRAAVYHSHQRSILDYYRVGYQNGLKMRQLNRPYVRLRDEFWFGPRRLYWTFLSWKRVCREFGMSATRSVFSAIGCVCRLMSKSIGVWIGQRYA